jgi:hypothetical protein
MPKPVRVTIDGVQIVPTRGRDGVEVRAHVAEWDEWTTVGEWTDATRARAWCQSHGLGHFSSLWASGRREPTAATVAEVGASA